VRIVLNEFIRTNFHAVHIDVKEVCYDLDKSLSKKYEVTGTPTLLFFKGRRLIKKHFGEISIKHISKVFGVN
jgi:thioredoxin-related protein